MAQAFTREQPRVAPLTATPILVEIEAEYIPLLFSALEKYHNRYFWVSDGDYSAGLQGVLRLERALLTNMSESIITELQRLYRLWDTALNGTQYTATPAGEGLPPNITPALPSVPPVSTDEPNAIRAHIGRLWQLGENAATGEAWPAGAGVEGSPELPASLSWAARLLGVQGVTDTGWLTPDEPVTLKRLLEANRINSTQDKNTIRNATTTLTDTVTAGGSVADAIGDFLTAAADAGTDGGVIAVQLATSAALLLQLQRINYALNGNPAINLSEPTLLFALRGDNIITSSNNVLSKINDMREGQANALSDIVINTGNTVARLGETVAGLTANEQLDAIRVAIRSLAGLEAAGQVTEGSALRLLVDLLDCICEGVNGPPPAPNNPQNPPTGSCLAENGSYYRCTGWYKVPNNARSVNGVTCDAWVPVFSGLAQMSLSQITTSAGSPTVEIANAQSEDRVVCFSWNFAGNDTAPLAASRYIAGFETGASPAFDPEVPPGLAVPAGFRGDVITADTAGPYGTLYTTLILFFPQGDTTPANNAFVGAEMLAT